MKVATITLFCNESFRLQDWKKYFCEYESEVTYQVIVNNGKEDDYHLLKETFPHAIILQSETSNMIASYNLAISYILSHTEADAILQITNDLRLQSDSISKLYSILFSNECCGAISPILLKKDSNVVETFGCMIDKNNLDFCHQRRDATLDKIGNITKECTGLPGGCFLTKTEVYQKIGLQDEKINMYADEVDFGIRVAKAGYMLMATSTTLSWHQHVFAPGKRTRNPKASYFMGRNHVYLAKKHFGVSIVIKTILRRLRTCFLSFASNVHHLRSREYFACDWAFLRGIVSGIFY